MVFLCRQTIIYFISKTKQEFFPCGHIFITCVVETNFFYTSSAEQTFSEEK